MLENDKNYEKTNLSEIRHVASRRGDGVATPRGDIVAWCRRLHNGMALTGVVFGKKQDGLCLPGRRT